MASSVLAVISGIFSDGGYPSAVSLFQLERDEVGCLREVIKNFFVF